MQPEKNIFDYILKFFDKLEDKIRGQLSREPIFYAIIGGAATVLFWRGVWYTADSFSFLNGPISIILSVLILLGTGLLVSIFIGDSIILSGVKHEKKIAEKTELEIEEEASVMVKIQKKLEKIEKDINDIKAVLKE